LPLDRYRFCALVDITGRNQDIKPTIPGSVRDALDGPWRTEWREAMQAEIDSIRAFDVYDAVLAHDVPPDHQVLPGRWVFTLSPQPS
jgi:hypothetical protein